MNPRTLALILAILPATFARAQIISTTTSPSGDLSISLNLTDGQPSYSVKLHNKPVLPASPLGLTFKDGGPLAHLQSTSSESFSHDETYPVVAGKSSTARDHYNQTTVTLTEQGGSGRLVQIVLRAYDEGVAFRYVLPEQPHLTDFALTDESTGFSLPASAEAWVLPMPNPAGHYEYLYDHQQIKDIKPNQFIGFPLLLRLPGGGPYIALTEANLNDYAGMCLQSPATLAGDVISLKGILTPRLDQPAVKVIGRTPHPTPWRVIFAADTLAPLFESNLILNLNDPCAIQDSSWIHPGKVQFLWWNGYLVGKNAKRGAVDTATVNHYTSAAAEFGFPYSSIDGLDVAWYGGKIPGYGENDITVPIPQLDIPAVFEHARQKNVRMRIWVASAGMRKQLDKALDAYAKWGAEGIMVDFIERDDQQDINWQRELVAKAAAHHLTVTLHNVPKPTGLSRTYPNLLTFEAVRNQEYDKWDPKGIPPEHNLTVPFTRMLAGPLDYHVGAFRSVSQRDFLPRDVGPDVMGSRCHQLAMYVVFDDPMPMAVDYPSAYRNRPGLDFLKEVPTTWDETKFLQGDVGQFIAIARRKGNDWYIGAMTDAHPRQLKIPLTFLKDGTIYAATTWADDPTGSLNALTRSTTQLTANHTLEASLTPAGGQVIHLVARQ